MHLAGIARGIYIMHDSYYQDDRKASICSDFLQHQNYQHGQPAFASDVSLLACLTLDTPSVFRPRSSTPIAGLIAFAPTSSFVQSQRLKL